MPIYEFYCPDCHTVFSFFSARIDTAAKPDCPRCGRPELGRKPSRFAAHSRGAEGAGPQEEGSAEDPLGGLDEARMAGAMDSLAAEMEHLDDAAQKDPKQLARFLSRFSEASGLEAGPRMQEMLARLEEGADPDELESEMGDGGETDDAGEGDFSDFFRPKQRAAGGRARRPRVDETLYFL